MKAERISLIVFLTVAGLIQTHRVTRTSELLSVIRERVLHRIKSKRVSRVICFKTGLQSAFRESFDSKRDFIIIIIITIISWNCILNIKVKHHQMASRCLSERVIESKELFKH